MADIEDFEFEETKQRKLTRAKKKNLRVTFPGEEPICYNRATDTFIEAIRRISVEDYPLITLESNHIRLLSQVKDKVHPEWQKPLKDGWYILFDGSTAQKYRQLLVINQQLDLGMNVELGYDFETTSAPKSNDEKKPRTRNASKLLVKMPDGTFIGESDPIDSYIQTLWEIGIEELKKKKINLSGMDLITTQKRYPHQMQVGEDRWASFPLKTKEKAQWLRIIAIYMKLKMEVTLL